MKISHVTFVIYFYAFSCLPGAITFPLPDIMLSVSKQLQVHVNCWKDSNEIPAIFYSLKFLHRFLLYRCDILSAERFEREMNVFCEIAMCDYQRCVMSCCVNILLAFFCFASISLCCALWVISVMHYLRKTELFKKLFLQVIKANVSIKRYRILSDTC